MLLAIDGIPGTLDDLTNVERPADVVILPVSQGTVKSLIHIVEMLLAQLRQTEMRGLGEHRLMSIYWSQIPFEATVFEQAYIRRHVLAMESRMRTPIRRVLVKVDKDYSFDKLAQQNTAVSTHELNEYVGRLESMFAYDRRVYVPPHAFETRSTRTAIFLELVANHGGS